MDSQQSGTSGRQPQDTDSVPTEVNVSIDHSRPAGSLNVPPRLPTAYTRDFDDEAFAGGTEWNMPATSQSALPRPSAVPTPAVQPPRQTLQPIAPQPVTSAHPASVTPVSYTPAASPTPITTPLPAPIPIPMQPPTPQPAPSRIASLQPIASPTLPPSSPPSPATPSPPAQPPIPPTPHAMPLTPPAIPPLNAVLSPSLSPPTPEVLSPPVPLNYPMTQTTIQPIASPPTPPKPPISPEPTEQTYGPSMQHLPAEMAERLGRPQNSKEVAVAAQHNQRAHRAKGFLSFVIFIAGIFLSAFLINQFIFQSYYVEGGSMMPNLQDNDRLILDKTERSLAKIQGKAYIPNRGDIVVFDSSIIGLNGENEQLIKRVIGLPGETVVIQDGKVLVKNTTHPEGFDVDKELDLHLLSTYTDAPIEVAIPPNQIFVMGDNRGQGGSSDSRLFGPIPADTLVGRLWARVLPVNKAALY